MNGSAEAEKTWGSRPYLAFLCSTFILPGLGQIMSGQRRKGLIMAGGASLWMIMAGFYFGWRCFQIFKALALTGEPLSGAVFRAGMAPYASHFLVSLAVLGGIWLWSAADAFRWSRSRALSRKAAVDSGGF